MFFAKLARVIAVVALVFGLWRAGIGLYAVSVETPEAREFIRVEFIGRKSPGQAIEQGIYLIVFSSVMGTLAGMALKRKE